MGYFTLPSKSRRLAAAAGRLSQGEPGQGEANSQGEEEVYRTVTRIRPVQVEVDMQSTLL